MHGTMDKGLFLILLIGMVVTIDAFKCYDGIVQEDGPMVIKSLEEKTCGSRIYDCIKYSGYINSSTGTFQDAWVSTGYTYKCGEDMQISVDSSSGCREQERKCCDSPDEPFKMMKTTVCYCGEELCNLGNSKGVNIFLTIFGTIMFAFLTFTI